MTPCDSSHAQLLFTNLPIGPRTDASKAVGIGIIFDAGESGAGPDGDGLVVNGLAPSGPAARSGKIMLGDILCTVDGMDVKGISAGLRAASCLVNGFLPLFVERRSTLFCYS